MGRSGSASREISGPCGQGPLMEGAVLCIRLKELGGWFGQGYLDTRARGTLDGCHVVLLQE
jgi:hypothetical protein